MTKWIEQLNNHAVFTTLSDLSERLKENALVSEDINVIELVDKIHQLVAYSDTSLRNVVPELVGTGTLNTANSHITNVRNELNNYISNSNIAHLNNAVSHVDAAMTQLVLLPVPNQQVSGETFSSSLAKFKSLIEHSFREIKEAKDQLQSSILELSEKSESQKRSISSLDEKIQKHEKTIESQLAQFNERFKVYELSANEKIDSSIEDSDEKITSLLARQDEKFKDLLAAQSLKGSSIIEALNLNKQQASDLVQVIGNIGITGNYQNIANQEKDAADKWRNIALFLMIAMVLVIAITIGITAANGFDWKLAVFRIGAALVLAIPATYAAKESSKHRLLENMNRKAELELASLDPFLEKLPEATRFKVKEELTSKFFGSKNKDEKHEDTDTLSALIDLLKVAISKK